MEMKGGWDLRFGDVKASVTVTDPQQCRIRGDGDSRCISAAVQSPHREVEGVSQSRSRSVVVVQDEEEWITDRVQGVEFEGSLDCWNTALVASPWRPSK